MTKSDSSEAAARTRLLDGIRSPADIKKVGEDDLPQLAQEVREELIKVAGMAKPTAKLGEKFQYQNIMYAAAGEVVAKAEKSTWDKLIASRIFKPLGMTNSDTPAAAMQKARDYSIGYDYNPTTKVTRRLPQREIFAAAPAGASPSCTSPWCGRTSSWAKAKPPSASSPTAAATSCPE